MAGTENTGGPATTPPPASPDTSQQQQIIDPTQGGLFNVTGGGTYSQQNNPAYGSIGYTLTPEQEQQVNANNPNLYQTPWWQTLLGVGKTALKTYLPGLAMAGIQAAASQQQNKGQVFAQNLLANSIGATGGAVTDWLKKKAPDSALAGITGQIINTGAHTLGQGISSATARGAGLKAAVTAGGNAAVPKMVGAGISALPGGETLGKFAETAVGGRMAGWDNAQATKTAAREAIRDPNLEENAEKLVKTPWNARTILNGKWGKKSAKEEALANLGPDKTRPKGAADAPPPRKMGADTVNGNEVTAKRPVDPGPDATEDQKAQYQRDVAKYEEEENFERKMTKDFDGLVYNGKDPNDMDIDPDEQMRILSQFNGMRGNEQERAFFDRQIEKFYPKDKVDAVMADIKAHPPTTEQLRAARNSTAFDYIDQMDDSTARVQGIHHRMSDREKSMLAYQVQQIQKAVGQKAIPEGGVSKTKYRRQYEIETALMMRLYQQERDMPVSQFRKEEKERIDGLTQTQTLEELDDMNPIRRNLAEQVFHEKYPNVDPEQMRRFHAKEILHMAKVGERFREHGKEGGDLDVRDPAKRSPDSAEETSSEKYAMEEALAGRDVPEPKHGNLPQRPPEPAKAAPRVPNAPPPPPTASADEKFADWQAKNPAAEPAMMEAAYNRFKAEETAQAAKAGRAEDIMPQPNPKAKVFGGGADLNLRTEEDIQRTTAGLPADQQDEIRRRTTRLMADGVFLTTRDRAKIVQDVVNESTRTAAADLNAQTAMPSSRRAQSNFDEWSARRRGAPADQQDRVRKHFNEAYPNRGRNLSPEAQRQLNDMADVYDQIGGMRNEEQRKGLVIDLLQRNGDELANNPLMAPVREFIGANPRASADEILNMMMDIWESQGGAGGAGPAGRVPPGAYSKGKKFPQTHDDIDNLPMPPGGDQQRQRRHNMMDQFEADTYKERNAYARQKGGYGWLSTREGRSFHNQLMRTWQQEHGLDENFDPIPKAPRRRPGRARPAPPPPGAGPRTAAPPTAEDLQAELRRARGGGAAPEPAAPPAGPPPAAAAPPPGPRGAPGAGGAPPPAAKAAPAGRPAAPPPGPRGAPGAAPAPAAAPRVARKTTSLEKKDLFERYAAERKAHMAEWDRANHGADSNARDQEGLRWRNQWYKDNGLDKNMNYVGDPDAAPAAPPPGAAVPPGPRGAPGAGGAPPPAPGPAPAAAGRTPDRIRVMSLEERHRTATAEVEEQYQNWMRDNPGKSARERWAKKNELLRRWKQDNGLNDEFEETAPAGGAAPGPDPADATAAPPPAGPGPAAAPPPVGPLDEPEDLAAGSAALFARSIPGRRRPTPLADRAPSMGAAPAPGPIGSRRYPTRPAIPPAREYTADEVQGMTVLQRQQAATTATQNELLEWQHRNPTANEFETTAEMRRLRNQWRIAHNLNPDWQQMSPEQANLRTQLIADANRHVEEWAAAQAAPPSDAAKRREKARFRNQWLADHNIDKNYNPLPAAAAPPPAAPGEPGATVADLNKKGPDVPATLRRRAAPGRRPPGAAAPEPAPAPAAAVPPGPRGAPGAAPAPAAAAPAAPPRTLNARERNFLGMLRNQADLYETKDLANQQRLFEGFIDTNPGIARAVFQSPEFTEWRDAQARAGRDITPADQIREAINILNRGIAGLTTPAPAPAAPPPTAGPPAGAGRAAPPPAGPPPAAAAPPAGRSAAEIHGMTHDERRRAAYADINEEFYQWADEHPAEAAGTGRMNKLDELIRNWQRDHGLNERYEELPPATAPAAAPAGPPRNPLTMTQLLRLPHRDDEQVRDRTSRWREEQNAIRAEMNDYDSTHEVRTADDRAARRAYEAQLGRNWRVAHNIDDNYDSIGLHGGAGGASPEELRAMTRGQREFAAENEITEDLNKWRDENPPDTRAPGAEKAKRNELLARWREERGLNEFYAEAAPAGPPKYPYGPALPHVEPPPGATAATAPPPRSPGVTFGPVHPAGTPEPAPAPEPEPPSQAVANRELAPVFEDWVRHNPHASDADKLQKSKELRRAWREERGLDGHYRPKAAAGRPAVPPPAAPATPAGAPPPPPPDTMYRPGARTALNDEERELDNLEKQDEGHLSRDQLDRKEMLQAKYDNPMERRMPPDEYKKVRQAFNDEGVLGTTRDEELRTMRMLSKGQGPKDAARNIKLTRSLQEHDQPDIMERFWQEGERLDRQREAAQERRRQTWARQREELRRAISSASGEEPEPEPGAEEHYNVHPGIKETAGLPEDEVSKQTRHEERQRLIDNFERAKEAPRTENDDRIIRARTKSDRYMANHPETYIHESEGKNEDFFRDRTDFERRNPGTENDNFMNIPGIGLIPNLHNRNRPDSWKKDPLKSKLQAFQINYAQIARRIAQKNNIPGSLMATPGGPMAMSPDEYRELLENGHDDGRLTERERQQYENYQDMYQRFWDELTNSEELKRAYRKLPMEMRGWKFRHPERYK